MKYAMLVYSDQSAPGTAMTEDEAAAARGQSRCRAGSPSSTSSGRPTRACRGVSSSSAAEAKVVRVVDGKTVVTDGPFAETKEQLGGVFITDLPDLDEAIRLAALVPAAEYGTLEIRPLDHPVSDRVAAVYAEEWPRCVAILTRVLGDLERAEDAVQDAFATALERWPQTGIPDNPGAWIVTDRPQPRHRPDPS